jgi:hypothetical protein
LVVVDPVGMANSDTEATGAAGRRPRAYWTMTWSNVQVADDPSVWLVTARPT